MDKLFYLKERNNPQFDKVYYVKMGQCSKTEAKKHEKTLYGSNTMIPFSTEQEYNDAIKQYELAGFKVNI